MTEPNFKNEDEKLGGLLREARSTPALPPRFLRRYIDNVALNLAAHERLAYA